jgi:6-phosphogluconolactonase
MRTRNTLGVVGIAIAALVGCSQEDTLLDPLDGGALSPAGSDRATGAVYLMNNDAAGNEVMVFRRSTDGSLTYQINVPTDGQGTGGSLGNQSGLALSSGRRWLLVVNAGSDDVSVFAVRPEGLVLTDREASGGEQPISVATHRNLVYVLNAGDPNNISGFRLTSAGELQPIPGSIQPLSAPTVGPAQVGFSPDGRILVVSEKGTNRLTTYTVDRNGLASAPNPQAAAGQTPFGFGFDHHGTLVVSEAFGGAADASTVSSYRVESNGTVDVIDATVPTTETAACWIAISANGRYAYTTNTGSGSITGFEIAASGDLTILNSNGETALTGPGSTPLDAAFSSGGRYLYVLSRGIGEISAFELRSDGSLEAISGAGGLPPAANGMVSF